MEKRWAVSHIDWFDHELTTIIEIRNGEQVQVSNGLFPPSRYRELAHRLDTLRRFKAKGGQV